MRNRVLPRLTALALSVLSCMGCKGDPGTLVAFDLDGAWTTRHTFFDSPWPSDLRIVAGKPDLVGFPNPRDIDFVTGLLVNAQERPGYPVMPVGYFRFSQALSPQDIEQVIAADAGSPVLLLDLAAGRLVPVVAQTLFEDDYLPANVLAVAPRPGFVLRAGQPHAFVVRRGLKDALGRPLGVPRGLDDLLHGRTPAGKRGADARTTFAPLIAALKAVGIAVGDVAAATVFTTGDVVAETAAISTALVPMYPIVLENLHVDPDDGAAHPRYCELHGQVRYPQFQRGTPPFDHEGRFDFAGGTVPLKQGEELAPIVITIPKSPMPAAGFPLSIYWHGSGGLSTQGVDRGRRPPGGEAAKGEGPAHVLAAHGLATAASALPVNPERLPGAGDTAYLNFNNLGAFRDLWRQGVIEQRMFIEALRIVEVPPSAMQACGITVPARFDPDQLVGMGQSMGGMYTNLLGATEPRLRALGPMGAGGFWSYFILKTSLIMGAPALVAALLGTDPPSFVHPAMHLFEMASEAGDPMVYMPRVGVRPLDGHPARPVYQPVGKGDSYFPTVLFDAVALAYDHEQAGDEVWPTMQQVLALAGLDGFLPYPIQQNRNGRTGVVVQYAGDGYSDPHAIFSQLDEVKYQYGCFFESFLATGVATVPAPAPLGTPCPR